MTFMDMMVALLYTLIGGTAALSLLIFCAGLGVYIVRLGTERRIAGIRVMEQGVRIILGTFVLIGILYILE